MKDGEIMSAHKKIPKKIRLLVYEKCNHRCAYCGCELEYKDMQVDHVKSVFANTDVSHTMTEEEMYSEKNFPNSSEVSTGVCLSIFYAG